jgi:hypothetical protein
MSIKIDINEVAQQLKSNKIAPEVTRRIIEALNHKVAEAKAEKGETAPKSKQQYVILLSDPEGLLKGKDFVGWVAQINEEEAPQTALERVKRAAHAFNGSRKGRLVPVNTVGEACENVSRKYLKVENVMVKTKIPVLAQVTDNTLGEAPSV